MYKLVSAILFASAVLPALPAHASVIVGNFVGTIDTSFDPSIPLEAEVIGSFSYDTSQVGPAMPDGSTNVYLVSSLSFNFTVAGQTFGDNGPYSGFFQLGYLVPETFEVTVSSPMDEEFEFDAGSATALFAPAGPGMVGNPGTVGFTVPNATAEVFWAPPDHDPLYPGRFEFAVVSATVGLAPTPLPAALPLFAGGLGLIGMIGRRKKRNTIAA